MADTGVFSLFVLLTSIQTISAAPNCDRNSVMACFTPVLSYFMGPGGQDLPATGDPADMTDKQFTDFCRIGMSFMDCYNDFFTRCAPGMADARKFASNTLQLMRRCDNPSFANDARTVFQCTSTLNKTKARTLACSNAANRWFKSDFRGVNPSQNGGRFDLTGWNDGSIFDGLCCNTKYYVQCSGNEVNDKCGPQAQKVFSSFQEAVMDVYGCNARTNKCPARPEPSPEDYTFRLNKEFMSLFTDNAGGETYRPMRYKTSSSGWVQGTYTNVGLVFLATTLLSARWTS